MKLTKLVLTFGLLVIASTLFAVDHGTPENVNQNQPDNNPKQLSFETNTTSQVLEHSVDLWHDAILKGNDKHANEYYDQIQTIIAEDILNSKVQMRALVSEIEQMYHKYSREGKNLLEEPNEQKELVEYKKYLPIISSSICIKEELFRALSRTDAFSNKYRLLGDYKSLLRRELNMPKLQIADIENEKTKQASTDK